MRKRRDARTGEIDTIAVNIQKGTAKLKKKHVEVGEQRAAVTPARVINTKHRGRKRARRDGKGGTVIRKVEKIYTMERD